MKKGIKYALLFTSGVVVGIGVCGASLISYALDDPDIRDGIKNKVYRKVDKLLHTESPKKNDPGKVGYRAYYDKTLRSDIYTKVDDIIFETRDAAEKAKEDMNEIIGKYGFVTVADLCDHCNISAPYTSSKYGWLDISGAKIVVKHDGYSIKLSDPLPL